MDEMLKTRFIPVIAKAQHRDDVCTGPSRSHQDATDATSIAEGRYAPPVAKPRDKSTTDAPRAAKPPRGSGLRACPFCRELFVDDETDVCPDCGIPVRELGSLPPSPEAEEMTALERAQRLPHAEPLPWKDMSRGRGVILACAVLGAGAFFLLPWASLSQPDVIHWSGMQLAQVKSFYWSALVAWMVLLPAVLSRRSIAKMIGARLACVMLAAWPAIQAATILLGQDRHPVRHGVAFELHWGAGIYVTLALSIVATLAAFRFGGRLDDVSGAKGSKARPAARDDDDAPTGGVLH